MSSESPDVVIYDVNGNALAVQNATAIPTNTPALMVAGSDGTDSRYLAVDSSGRQIVVGAGTAGAPVGGVVSVQGVSGGTAVPVSGTVTANQGTANSLANAWTTELTDGSHGPVAVKGASTAAVATDPALVVAISPNNSLTVSNPSVGAPAAAVPADATFVGGEVQALQSGLTTGDLYPLSLTTAGLLRVDGSNVTQPVSGTVTATVSGTVTANQGTAGALTNGWSTVQASTNIAIQTNATVTADGASSQYFGLPTGPLILYILIGAAPTGTSPTITYTINEFSPSGFSPVVNQVQTAALSASGLYTLILPACASGVVDVAWVIGGTTPSFTLVYTNLVPLGGTAITDGTHGPVAVKAASTAAIAADPSLVIALSPNSPLPAGTNTLGAVNQGTANTLVNAWTTELTDGINGPVAVKAPSTAAVATDAALAVALSPNSPLPAGTNALGTVTVTGTNADGTTFTGNPVVAAGVDFNSLAQNISATTLNGLTHLNVADLQTQNKLDMIILLLTDIRDALLNNNNSPTSE